MIEQATADEGLSISLRFRAKLRSIESKVLSVRPATLLVYVATLFYIVSIGSLSLQKYQTFNSTYSSLGITTHQVWLLSHGGVSLYYATHFQTVAWLWSKPLVFLLVPAYWVYPHAQILLVLQTVALGGAAIPLFYLARRGLKSELLAVLIAISWLVYFPISNANLSDELTICWFPLLFFSSAYFLVVGKRAPSLAFAILAGCVNILASALMLVFVILFPVGGGVTSTADTAVRPWPAVIIDSFRSRWYIGSIATLSGVLLALLIPAYLSGNTQLVSGSSTSSSPISVLLTDINVKLLLFAILFAPVAFLPLFDLRSLILLLPFAAFIFYANNPGVYVAFGHPYMAMAAAPIYFGVIRVIDKVQRIDKRLDPTTQTPSRPFRLDRPQVTTQLACAFVLTSCIFGLVYFPLSPLNAEVSGGLFAGNQETGTITDVTPETTFLWKVIDLIPPTASVLTQNNIPQLSDREYFEVPEVPSTWFVPDYVLVDTSLVYFSVPQDLFGYINDSLANHTYGVVAEGLGALLIERGYSGPLQLYVPPWSSYDSSNLSVYDGTIVGSSIVGGNQSYSMWFGPYISLYPGTYTATYYLQSNLSGPSSTPLLTLDVTVGAQSTVLNQTIITPSNFTAANAVEAFQLTFSVSQIVQFIQLRGMFPTGVAHLTLDGITLQGDSRAGGP